MNVADVVWLATVLAGGFVAVGCFRVSSWHTHEADYWWEVHARSLLDSAGTDRRYLPVLQWKHAHPPSLWTRLRKWRDPEERFAREHARG